VNSTFYAYPSEKTVEGWLKSTKPGFIFSAKIPGLITHEKKLDPKQGVEENLNRFCKLNEYPQNH